MTIALRESTASQEIPLGYFVDISDGNTEEVSLTIANTDIKIWKTGATTLANKNTGGATHISNGIYYAVLDDTDTNTLGPLKIFVHISATALPVILECEVYPANVYDSLFSTDNLQVDVLQISGDATAADNLELDYDGTGLDRANSTIGTVTTNTDMVGTDSAFLAASAPTNFSSLSITVGGLVDITQTAADKVWATATRTLTSFGTLVSDIWDEVLTAATHNVTTSSGRRLRDTSAVVILSGTVTGAGTGNNQAVINGDASTIDNIYVPGQVNIVGGTGVGQSRGISNYDGATKTITTNHDWIVNPDVTSEYTLNGDSGSTIFTSGIVAAADASTVTLAAHASAQDDLYNQSIVKICSGTGAQQARVVLDYNGTTKIATIDTNWTITPDTTSTYGVMCFHLDKTEILNTNTNIGTPVNIDSKGATISANLTTLADDNAGTTYDATTDSQEALGAAAASTPAQIADAVWDEAIADHLTSGTTGKKLNDVSVTTSTGANEFNITAKKDNTSGALLGNTIFVITDVAATTTYHREKAGTTGTIGVALDNGTYSINLYLPNYTGSNPQTLTVTDDTAQEFYMTAFDPGNPTLPDQCRVSNNHVDGDGEAREGVTWTAQVIVSPPISSSSFIDDTEIITSTDSDSDGNNYLDMIQGVRYRVNVDNKSYNVTVPSTSTAVLSSILE